MSRSGGGSEAKNGVERNVELDEDAIATRVATDVVTVAVCHT
jgi:hypothetical protein